MLYIYSINKQAMKKTISMTIEESVIDSIKEIARADNRSLSNLAEKILQAYIDSEQEKSARAI